MTPVSTKNGLALTNHPGSLPLVVMGDIPSKVGRVLSHL
jgi:hypothetical protein